MPARVNRCLVIVFHPLLSVIRWSCLVLLVFLVSCGTPGNTRDGKEDEPESVALTAEETEGVPSAREAASTMGRGFNLGQFFDAGQYVLTFENARAKIDAYYALGFRHVRIPVTWTEPVQRSVLADPETGVVNRNHPRLAVIRQVVDYALSLPDMYVVIDAHHEVHLKDQGREAVLARLWQDIAELFRDKDGRLLFEILNEPHLSNREPMDPVQARRMQAAAWRAIRKVDPRRIVIIGGNRWFAADELAITWPNLSDVGAGRDPYLMATFHHYHPWAFNGDHQGSYDDPWTDQDLYGPMDQALDWARTSGQGIPIYIGEWGTGWGSRYGVMRCNNIRLWYQKFHARYARARGIPASVWDDGGWFGIFDHHSGAFANNLADCIDGQCDWDGDERFNEYCD